MLSDFQVMAERHLSGTSRCLTAQALPSEHHSSYAFSTLVKVVITNPHFII
jgi:hypothetical protein